jgi:hypothetical protein
MGKIVDSGNFESNRCRGASYHDKFLKYRNFLYLFLILLGTLLGAHLSSIFFNFSQGSNSLENISKIISSEEVNTFTPGISDRKFWDSIEPKPPRLNSDEFQSVLSNPYDTIFTGLHQLCYYPEDTNWHAPINSSLSKILSDNDWDVTMVGLDVSARTALLANAVSMLGVVVEPGVKEKFNNFLWDAIYNPFLSEYTSYQKTEIPSSRFPWLSSNSNWKSVCTFNIVYGALASADDPQKKALIIAAACDIIPEYLLSFEEDGYFSGGIRYWNYGFSHFVLLAQRLFQATDGAIDLFNSPLIPLAIKYPLSTYGFEEYPNDRRVYPLFGDNQNPPVDYDWLWAFLKDRYSFSFDPKVSEDTLLSGLAPYLLISPYRVKSEYPLRIEEVNPNFYSSGSLYTFRDNKNLLFFAVKGGNNDEEHNHNDVGSYTLFERGPVSINEVIGDLGVEPYAKNHFAWEHRYTFDGMGSHGHPLPVVGGTLQSNGPQFYGELLEDKSRIEEGILFYDLLHAYDYPPLISLVRGITFRDGELIVKDSYVSSNPTTFSTIIPTRYKPKLEGSDLILAGFNSLFRVKFTASGPYKIRSRPSLYFKNSLLFEIALEGKNSSGFIEYSIQRLRPSEGS